jgi:hypothetical protein
VRVNRDVLESKLTETIRRDLLSAEVVDEFRARLSRALRRPNPARGRRQQLQRKVDNIVEAISKGLLSPALSARLETAEKELAELCGDDKVIDARTALALVGPAVEA